MTPEIEDALRTVTLVTAKRVERIIFVLSMVAAAFAAYGVCEFFNL